MQTPMPRSCGGTSMSVAVIHCIEHCQTLQNLDYQILDVCEVSGTPYST